MFPSKQNWFQRLKYLTELEKLWKAKPSGCSVYEQICIPPVFRSIKNLSRCQETTRGYSLPEKYVSHKVVQAQTMLSFVNYDILDLAQKS